MQQSLKKGILTHSLVILGFFLVTLSIYYPEVLSNKKLYQHDILQGQGAHHQITEYREQTGEEPLWMNSMFSGMPSYLNGVYFSGDILQHVYNLMTLYLGHPSGITFVGCLCFYILLLTFKVRPWVAFIGAITFSLNGFNIIGISAGHNSKIAAVALLPLIIAGMRLAFSKKVLIGLSLTALGLGLQLRTGHFQITYYTAIIAGVYGLSELIQAYKAGQLKSFSFVIVGLLLAAVLGLSTNAGRLWTIFEYSKVSIRGKSELKSDGQASSGLDKEYAFEFSNGIFEPLVLFVPNTFGGSSGQELSKSSATAEALRTKAGYAPAQVQDTIKSMPTYWGNQRLSAPYYAGSILVLLFCVGLFILKKSEKYWLATLVVIGIVLSWGSSFSTFNYLLFDYLPYYNKFRSVTFSIIITMFGLNMLGFMALDRLFDLEWNKEKIRTLLKAYAIPTALVVLILISAGFLSYKGSIDERLPDWLLSALREDRASLLRKDAFRVLFFLAAFGGLLWLYIKKKWSNKLIIGSILILMFCDIFFLSKRFIKESSFQKAPSRSYFQANAADQLVLSKSKPGERVLNLQNPFNEARTSYHHESIGGYHGAKMRRYQDLIEQQISPEMNKLISKLQKGKRDFSSLPALNMLNTKFLLAGDSKDAVLENPNALGNAWIVNEILAVNSPNEELIKIGQIDPQFEAIIDENKFSIPSMDTNAQGKIKLLERKPRHIKYEADLSGNALAVFSEIYYPNGWNATIDNNPTEILRANYVLRALPINSGKHIIEFRFEPKSYIVGNTIMLLASILIIVLMIVALALSLKNSLIKE